MRDKKAGSHGDNHYRTEKIISHSREHVFAIIANIQRYPDFLPWCQGAQVISQTESGCIADLEVGQGGWTTYFRSQVTLTPPCHITMHGSGPLIQDIRGVWSLETVFQDRSAWQMDRQNQKRLVSKKESSRVGLTLDWHIDSFFLKKGLSFILPSLAPRLIQAFQNRAYELSLPKEKDKNSL